MSRSRVRAAGLAVASKAICFKILPAMHGHGAAASPCCIAANIASQAHVLGSPLLTGAVRLPPSSSLTLSLALSLALCPLTLSLTLSLAPCPLSRVLTPSPSLFPQRSPSHSPVGKTSNH